MAGKLLATCCSLIAMLTISLTAGALIFRMAKGLAQAQAFAMAGKPLSGASIRKQDGLFMRRIAIGVFIGNIMSVMLFLFVMKVIADA